MFRQREMRSERIRDEVLRWANPILGAVTGLESRLANILDDSLYLALDADLDKERPVDDDWAIGHEYAMESTLFLFAEYFAWIRLLQQRLSFELFQSRETNDRFLAAVWDVSKALSRWPDESVVGFGTDAQVFALQQRAIGELLIRSDPNGQKDVVGYPEFLSLRVEDARLEHVLSPLVLLLQGVEPATKRWCRLVSTREALGALRAQCDGLLGLERIR